MKLLLLLITLLFYSCATNYPTDSTLEAIDNSDKLIIDSAFVVKYLPKDSSVVDFLSEKTMILSGEVNIDTSITIPSGSVLFVTKGSVIKFAFEKELIIHGSLFCLGDDQDSITFTSIDSSNSWGGLCILSRGVDTTALRNVIIEDASKTHHTSTQVGGGLHIDSDRVSIENSNIRFNRALPRELTSHGGGIYIYNSKVKISNTTIYGNLAQSSGGGIYMSYSDVILDSCIIENNHVTEDFGYGSKNGGGFLISKGNTLIKNCEIKRNSAPHGGGIYYMSSNGVVENSIFEGNRSITYGGALSMNFESFPVIKNCLILDNIAGVATLCAIMNFSAPKFINCTIYSSKEKNKMIYTRWNERVLFLNCILYSSDYSDDLIELSASINNVDIVSCNVGSDFIMQDPKFVDVANRDFRLSQSSPYINKGSMDSSDVQSMKYDFNGNRRVSDTIIDIGAFEYTE